MITRRIKRLIWAAVLVLAGFALGASAMAGEGGGNRGRSGERFRNRDPRGPHTGMRHRNGQLDQGWHRRGGGKEDDKKGEGCKRGRGGTRGNMRERFKNMSPEKRGQFREKMRERFGNMDPEKREEIRNKIRERIGNMDPEKRREFFKRRRNRRSNCGGDKDGKDGQFRGEMRERFGDMDPEKRDQMKKLREHWDRGLHRGDNPEKGKGGGRFGKERGKWFDYDGKPGNGNENPGGPKE